MCLVLLQKVSLAVLPCVKGNPLPGAERMSLLAKFAAYYLQTYIYICLVYYLNVKLFHFSIFEYCRKSNIAIRSQMRNGKNVARTKDNLRGRARKPWGYQLEGAGHC